jgi:phosphatidyl-myo-inositol alpha-mannosyltransferase
VKVGIVVPYSWSFWGAVVEHAELQAATLERLGFDVRLIMGNDPPGSFTRALHPRLGRHGDPPANVIPVGRSVIVPANDSLPNIVLSPRAVFRMRRVLERERFDVLHLHEPLTPIPCTAALALARTPVVATFHASGRLAWTKLAIAAWGFLLDRIDHRIAVSEQARDSAAAYAPGAYDIVPNGVLVPPHADPGGRAHQVAFVGRHEPRKGLHVLLRAWPTIHRETGARLRVIGADPLRVGLLQTRLGLAREGIDVVGFLSQDDLTAELLRAKALVAPSLGGESFGMVLTRAFACATPAIASAIPGYRDVMTSETGMSVPPGDPAALAQATIALLEDEPRRSALGAAARRLARERYSWDEIGRRLGAIYEIAAGHAAAREAALR